MTDGKCDQNRSTGKSAQGQDPEGPWIMNEYGKHQDPGHHSHRVPDAVAMLPDVICYCGFSRQMKRVYLLLKRSLPTMTRGRISSNHPEPRQSPLPGTILVSGS